MSDSERSYEAVELWDNLGLVPRRRTVTETSDGVVVQTSEDERFVFKPARPRLRDIWLRRAPTLAVEHSYVEYYDPVRDETVQTDPERLQWVLAQGVGEGTKDDLDPTPREQIERCHTIMQNHPIPVSPALLEALHQSEGEITVRLPRGIRLSRAQRREIAQFIKRLARGYVNTGEILMPQPAKAAPSAT